jgi:TonB family protein
VVDHRKWTAYVLFSLLLHGVVFSLWGMAKETIEPDQFVVSLVSEASPIGSRPQGALERPRAKRPAQKEEQPKAGTPQLPRMASSVAAVENQKADADSRPEHPLAGIDAVVPSASTQSEDHRTSPPKAISVAGSAATLAVPGNSPRQLTHSAGVGDRTTGRGTGETSVVAGFGTPTHAAGAGGDTTGRNSGAPPIVAVFGTPNGPRFLYRELTEYPLLAKRRRQEGRVVLSLSLSEKGSLTGVEVVEASNAIFVAPSIEAVRRSRFAPATRNGIPVAVKALLPIRFTIKNESLEDHT